MHIVIDARIIHSTTGRYVERLLHHLQDTDKINDYTVLVPSKDLEYWKPSAKNFTVVAADFKNYSFGEQFGFKTLIESLKPDLVHFCMPQQPLLYMGPIITTFHDLTLLDTYNSDKNWLVFHAKQLVGRFVFYIVAHKSKRIITPTAFVKKDVGRRLHVSPDKITVTHEAADKVEGEPKPFPLPFSRYIMYVGQQSDYKNIKRLGDAHHKLKETYPDLGLVLVGSRNASVLKNEEYFTDQQYKDIIFSGFVEDAQLSWLYQNCAAYVFPSLMEGFGLPGLEAMTYGAPVASSNISCLPEVYGNAAHYFNPNDSDDIVRAVNDILSDPLYRDELIEKGYEQVAKYSWQRMAEQTHTIYLQAAAE